MMLLMMTTIAEKRVLVIVVKRSFLGADRKMDILVVPSQIFTARIISRSGKRVEDQILLVAVVEEEVEGAVEGVAEDAVKLKRQGCPTTLSCFYFFVAVVILHI